MTVGQKISAAPNRTRKISEANKGRQFSPEHIEKLRSAKIGTVQPLEARQKRAETMKKIWKTRPREFSEEARKNMSEGHKRKKMTLEQIAARSAGQRGLKRSAETRAKMSASRKRVAEEKRLELR